MRGLIEHPVLLAGGRVAVVTLPADPSADDLRRVILRLIALLPGQLPPESDPRWSGGTVGSGGQTA